MPKAKITIVSSKELTLHGRMDAKFFCGLEDKKRTLEKYKEEIEAVRSRLTKEEAAAILNSINLFNPYLEEIGTLHPESQEERPHTHIKKAAMAHPQEALAIAMANKKHLVQELEEQILERQQVMQTIEHAFVKIMTPVTEEQDDK